MAKIIDPKTQFFDELKRVVVDELVESGTNLKPWTPAVAKSFHDKPINELIESDYFLNLKEGLHPFHKDLIEELYEEKRNRQISLVIVFAGIGSGKSYLASVLEWIEWYRFTTTPYPEIEFPFIDIAKSTIAFILMSKDANKAKHIVFNYVYNMFKTEFNKEFFPPNPKVKSYLHIPRNKTVIFPGTGEATSALGFNVFSGIVDEGAFLQHASSGSSSEEIEDQAEAMYDQIHGRIFSRFGSKGGLLIFISSANKVDGWMEKQVDYAIKNPNKSNIFWKRAPLWKCKPANFFPSGQYFLFNAKTFEIVTDPDMIDEYYQAKDRLQLTSDFNTYLGGLLL
jgi:hypothetical protein